MLFFLCHPAPSVHIEQTATLLTQMLLTSQQPLLGRNSFEPSSLHAVSPRSSPKLRVRTQAYVISLRLQKSVDLLRDKADKW